MSAVYIKDLIVRLQVGLPIHARDVDFLVPALEELYEKGTWQEGYEEGYVDASKDAENQVNSILDENQDTLEDLVIALTDFEVER